MNRLMKGINVFLIILTLTPSILFSQIDTWDGSSVQWTHGSGTQNDPYLIENAENIAWLAQTVNGGKSYKATYFRMTIDLNLRNLGWTAIGFSGTFQGIFDGDGHFIDSVSATLFGNLNYASITHLGANTAGGLSVYASNSTFVQCYNTGNITHTDVSYTYGGGICGRASGCTFSGCHNSGDLLATGPTVYAGGICGTGSGSSQFIQCYNTGKIEAKSSGGACYAGGICGDASNGSFTSCENSGSVYSQSNSSSHAGGMCGYSTNIICYQCHNSGSVSGQATSSSSSYAYVGGIGGRTSNSSFSECYNEGFVSSTNTAGTSSYAACRVGGICGYGSDATFTKCFNTNAITANSKSPSSASAMSAGICGSTDGATQFVQCFNTGTVDSYTESPSAYSYSGGISGYGGSFNQCYNTGQISGVETTGSPQSYVGGICAYADQSTFSNCYNAGILIGNRSFGISSDASTNCYFLDSCNGNYDTDATKETENDMKSPGFPFMLNAGSDLFITDIVPNVNQGYPIFGYTVCTVTTNAADNVTSKAARLSGQYETGYYWPTGNADTQGFEYKLSGTAKFDTVYTSPGLFSATVLTTLQPNSTYVARMFITRNGKTFYGNTVTFTTLGCDLSVDIKATKTSFCEGENAILTAQAASNITNLFNYEWNDHSFGDQKSVSSAGTYAVTVSDENGCTSSDSIKITVNQPSASEFSVTAYNGYVWNGQIYTQNGDYQQVLTNKYGCDSIVTLHLKLTVGIDGNTRSPFAVYPNPTSGEVHISNAKSVPGAELRIYTIEGQLIANKRIDEEMTTINLHTFPEGLYFIRLYTNDKNIHTEKIVLTR